MLIDKLESYSKSGAYPFHMPGHKRFELDSRLPYTLDITEIEGFDNLHEPSGCLREIERKAELLYNAKRAFLLVNGATAGILASVRAVTTADDKVLIARNCHKSVYNAVELCSLNSGYLLPEIIEGRIYGAVSAEDVKLAFEQSPYIRAVVITSPTYEGICSDIAAIAAVCREYSAVLIVDEAHGAHFPFGKSFPESALSQGADIAVTSLHKTLPAPTQTALLLSNSKALEQELQINLGIFQTSSPSYPLMCGIELCLEFIKNSPDKFDAYAENLDSFYGSVRNLSFLRVIMPGEWGSVSRDIGKLLVFTDPDLLTGYKLADILRTEYKLEIEMAAPGYIIAMTSVTDSREGFSRLSTALNEIDDNYKNIPAHNRISGTALLTELPKPRFSAAGIRSMKPEKISLPIENAVGRVALEYISAYPPGIPITVPGEIIGEETVRVIESLKISGANIISSEKNSPGFVTVAEL